MAITRVFLGHQHAPLDLAADYLIERYRIRQTVDMSESTVVTPGRRAGRRLLEILIERCEEQRLVLIPPARETVGTLPEQLYIARRALAGSLVRQLALTKVLRGSGAAVLQRLMAAAPPQDDLLSWLPVARQLADQHAELAAEGLDFSHVADCWHRMQVAAEAARWSDLRRLQSDYLAILDDLGVWDPQTARRIAIEQVECEASGRIELVGVVDLTKTLRRMLDQVSDYVTALVFAPQSHADRFDAYGCVIPPAWEDVLLPIAADQLHVAEGPASQADRVARCLADLDGRYRPDEISIGLADESIAVDVERQLKQVGVNGRMARGKPLLETPPSRLLAAVAAYLRAPRFAELASLVRHADVSDWLERNGVCADWLEHLDEYQNARLPVPASPELEGAKEDFDQVASHVYWEIDRLLQPLDQPPLSIRSGCEAIVQFLQELYGHRLWDHDRGADREYLAAFGKINEVLSLLAGEVPPSLLPDIRSADVIELCLSQLESLTLPEPVDAEAIELVGWLEMALDDAPVAIVCGFNEGHIPSSAKANLFLSDEVRRNLGMEDDRRRFARDMYATWLLLATHQRVDLIVARSNRDGDPLVPSRLLFAAKPDVMVERVEQLFGQPPADAVLPPLVTGPALSAGGAQFSVPRPEPLTEPITAMRVTAFRDYLACPYRFYLTHVLGLEPAHDQAEELDGAGFGTLIHDVLQAFGSGPVADSTSVDEIAEFLEQELARCAAKMFGKKPRAAVMVQLQQMRLRLTAFAEKQAAWANDGWTIKSTEVPSPAGGPAPFEVDGMPFGLRGRIDRIDIHRETGQQIVLDYKSWDEKKTPDAAHRRYGQWVDLQLPLYRHLARAMGLQADVKLGYVLLPKNTKAVGFSVANWSREELEQADEVARDVVRAIRAERFWPPTTPAPRIFSALASICQDSVYRREEARD